MADIVREEDGRRKMEGGSRHQELVARNSELGAGGKVWLLAPGYSLG
jgi:hypothetical protein